MNRKCVSTKHLDFYAKVHRINSLIHLINSRFTTVLIKLSSLYAQIDPSLCPALCNKSLTFNLTESFMLQTTNILGKRSYRHPQHPLSIAVLQTPKIDTLTLRNLNWPTSTACDIRMVWSDQMRMNLIWSSWIGKFMPKEGWEYHRNWLAEPVPNLLRPF